MSNKNQRLKTRQFFWIRLALPIFFLLAFFQNCAKLDGQPLEDPDEGSAAKIVGDTRIYNSILYDYSYRYGPAMLGPSISQIQISLNSGEGALLSGGTVVKSCSLSSTLLSSMRNLLASAKVCEPGPLPPGSAVCMAMPMPDIQLSNGQDMLQLSGLICNSGVFLCDGLDVEFRQLLKQAVAACQ